MKFSHCSLFVVALTCCFNPVSAAEVPTVVVVYPDVSSPYRESFEEILSGIGKRTPAYRVVVSAPGIHDAAVQRLGPRAKAVLG